MMANLDYPAVIAGLLELERLAPLGPGEPNRQVQGVLQGLTAESLCAPRPVRDEAMARACLAALWLYHDFLDESHTLSQDIQGPTGSYWHGLMHRREPDAGNAAYWFRRVGNHPVFAPLNQEANRLAAQASAGDQAAFLINQKDWDPFAFIDLCEAVRGQGSAAEMLCGRIQQREWELLFAHSYRQAIGLAD
jgi:hypothetical protein